MKKWYESKTVWFNIVTGTLAVLAFPSFVNIIPTAAEPYLAVINALGNWILRTYFTTTAIQDIPPIP